MKVILRAVGKGILWIVRLWLLAYVVALIVSPAWFTYQFVGWRWAVVAAVTTIGVVTFIAKFGPWLIGRWLARSLAEGMESAAEQLVEEIEAGKWDGEYTTPPVASHVAAEGIEGSYFTP